jgi:hypothetical protein
MSTTTYARSDEISFWSRARAEDHVPSSDDVWNHQGREEQVRDSYMITTQHMTRSFVEPAHDSEGACVEKYAFTPRDLPPPRRAHVAAQLPPHAADHLHDHSVRGGDR